MPDPATLCQVCGKPGEMLSEDASFCEPCFLVNATVTPEMYLDTCREHGLTVAAMRRMTRVCLAARSLVATQTALEELRRGERSDEEDVRTALELAWGEAIEAVVQLDGKLPGSWRADG